MALRIPLTEVRGFPRGAVGLRFLTAGTLEVKVPG